MPWTLQEMKAVWSDYATHHAAAMHVPTPLGSGSVRMALTFAELHSDCSTPHGSEGCETDDGQTEWRGMLLQPHHADWYANWSPRAWSSRLPFDPFDMSAFMRSCNSFLRASFVCCWPFCIAAYNRVVTWVYARGPRTQNVGGERV